MVLGFNYLHLVRDLPGTLRRIHALLAAEGLFIFKTPCLGHMNPLIGSVAFPAMRVIGKAPYAGVFRVADLSQHIRAAGFDILATESHATKGNDNRPYVVARKWWRERPRQELPGTSLPRRASERPWQGSRVIKSSVDQVPLILDEQDWRRDEAPGLVGGELEHLGSRSPDHLAQRRLEDVVQAAKGLVGDTPDPRFRPLFSL